MASACSPSQGLLSSKRFWFKKQQFWGLTHSGHSVRGLLGSSLSPVFTCNSSVKSLDSTSASIPNLTVRGGYSCCRGLNVRLLQSSQAETLIASAAVLGLSSRGRGLAQEGCTFPDRRMPQWQGLWKWAPLPPSAGCSVPGAIVEAESSPHQAPDLPPP